MRSNEVHFVLLAGAGLLLRTFFNLQSAPTGFRAENVLTLHMVVADADEARALEERVSQIPGVRAAGSFRCCRCRTRTGTAVFLLPAARAKAAPSFAT